MKDFFEIEKKCTLPPKKCPGGSARQREAARGSEFISAISMISEYKMLFCANGNLFIYNPKV